MSCTSACLPMMDWVLQREASESKPPAVQRTACACSISAATSAAWSSSCTMKASVASNEGSATVATEGKCASSKSWAAWNARAITYKHLCNQEASFGSSLRSELAGFLFGMNLEPAQARKFGAVEVDPMRHGSLRQTARSFCILCLPDPSSLSMPVMGR